MTLMCKYILYEWVLTLTEAITSKSAEKDMGKVFILTSGIICLTLFAGLLFKLAGLEWRTGVEMRQKLQGVDKTEEEK